MNEQQRQNYLQILGIQSWFPRFILPGAKSSAKRLSAVKTERSDGLASIAEAPLPLDNTGSCPHTVSMINQMMNSINANEIASRKEINTHKIQRNAIAEAATATVPLAKTAFNLAAIDVTSEILVVTDMPLATNTVLTTASKRLLFFVFFSLGWLQSTASSGWKSDVFSWPMAGMPANSTEQDASEAVQGFLNNRFNLQQKKYVLLSGPFSARYTLGNYQKVDALYGVSVRENGAKWGISYSLDQILKLPDIKAEVWQHLAPLAIR